MIKTDTCCWSFINGKISIITVKIKIKKTLNENEEKICIKRFQRERKKCQHKYVYNIKNKPNKNKTNFEPVIYD